MVGRERERENEKKKFQLIELVQEVERERERSAKSDKVCSLAFFESLSNKQNNMYII